MAPAPPLGLQRKPRSAPRLLPAWPLGWPWGHLTHFPEATLQQSAFGERPSPGRAEGGSLTVGAGDMCPEPGAPSLSGPARGSEARGLWRGAQGLAGIQSRV